MEQDKNPVSHSRPGADGGVGAGEDSVGLDDPLPASPTAGEEPPESNPNRTWVNQELELLISAAIVFTLFQVPAALDAAFLRVDIHLSTETGMFTFLPYYLAKLVVYGLIATFSLHFLMRSLWVALLGLRSAYPGGIRWQRLNLGPVALKRYRGLPTVESLEVRVDRMASSLFAFLFVFLVMMTMAGVWAVVVGGLSHLLARWLWPESVERATMILFAVLMGLFALVNSAAAFVDRALGGQHARRFPRWTAKALDRVYAVSQRAGPNTLFLPIFFTLSSSRISRSRLNLILVVFIYALIGVFMVGMLADRGMLRLDSYSYYPDRTESRGMQARHYDSLRPPDRPATVPSLSSDVADGPYLRLFLPYDAGEDNKRIAALCPDLAPLHGEGLRLRSKQAPPEAHLNDLLECLGAVYRVTLDGEPLEDGDWVFFTHPAGDVRGWVTYLPTAGLAPGRHMVEVAHRPLPRPAEEAGAEAGRDGEGTAEGTAAGVPAEADDEEHDSSRDEYFLPFWK